MSLEGGGGGIAGAAAPISGPHLRDTPFLAACSQLLGSAVAAGGGTFTEAAFFARSAASNSTAFITGCSDQSVECNVLLLLLCFVKVLRCSVKSALLSAVVHVAKHLETKSLNDGGHSSTDVAALDAAAVAAAAGGATGGCRGGGTCLCCK